MQGRGIGRGSGGWGMGMAEEGIGKKCKGWEVEKDRKWKETRRGGDRRAMGVSVGFILRIHQWISLSIAILYTDQPPKFCHT
jgi:hypothetical protein